jgi:hypothetical protein
MAIQKTLRISKSGFLGELVAENAYHKVVSVTANKQSASAHVAVFDKKDGVQLDSKFFEFHPMMNNVNFIAQAYEHLKTLPEFAGATDC